MGIRIEQEEQPPPRSMRLLAWGGASVLRMSLLVIGVMRGVFGSHDDYGLQKNKVKTLIDTVVKLQFRYWYVCGNHDVPREGSHWDWFDEQWPNPTSQTHQETVTSMFLVADPQFGFSVPRNADAQQLQASVERDASQLKDSLLRMPKQSTVVFCGDMTDAYPDVQEGADHQKSDRQMPAFHLGENFEVVLVNTERIKAGDKSELKLLREKLSDASIERQVVLVGHTPPFLDKEDEGDAWYNIALVQRQKLLHVVKHSNRSVRAWFCGHLHFPHHGCIRTTSGQEIPVIVLAAVGANWKQRPTANKPYPKPVSTAPNCVTRVDADGTNLHFRHVTIDSPDPWWSTPTPYALMKAMAGSIQLVQTADVKSALESLNRSLVTVEGVKHVSHVGSTAVEGLDAKPVLDVAVLTSYPVRAVADLFKLLDVHHHWYKTDHTNPLVGDGSFGWRFVNGTHVTHETPAKRTTVNVHVYDSADPLAVSDFELKVGLVRDLNEDEDLLEMYRAAKGVAARHPGRYNDIKSALFFGPVYSARNPHAPYMTTDGFKGLLQAIGCDGAYLEVKADQFASDERHLAVQTWMHLGALAELSRRQKADENDLRWALALAYQDIVDPNAEVLTEHDTTTVGSSLRWDDLLLLQGADRDQLKRMNRFRTLANWSTLQWFQRRYDCDEIATPCTMRCAGSTSDKSDEDISVDGLLGDEVALGAYKLLRELFGVSVLALYDTNFYYLPSVDRTPNHWEGALSEFVVVDGSHYTWVTEKASDLMLAMGLVKAAQLLTSTQLSRLVTKNNVTAKLGEALQKIKGGGDGDEARMAQSQISVNNFTRLLYTNTCAESCDDSCANTTSVTCQRNLVDNFVLNAKSLDDTAIRQLMLLMCRNNLMMHETIVTPGALTIVVGDLQMGKTFMRKIERQRTGDPTGMWFDGLLENVVEALHSDAANPKNPGKHKYILRALYCAANGGYDTEFDNTVFGDKRCIHPADCTCMLKQGPKQCPKHGGEKLTEFGNASHDAVMEYDYDLQKKVLTDPKTQLDALVDVVASHIATIQEKVLSTLDRIMAFEEALASSSQILPPV